MVGILEGERDKMEGRVGGSGKGKMEAGRREVH